MADSKDGSWVISQDPSTGMITYRASGLGSCEKALHAERGGMAPIKSVYAPLQKAFDEGNRLEPIVIQELVDSGWVVNDSQEEVVIQIADNVRVVGHIDGTGYVPFGQLYDGLDIPNEQMVLEIKGFAESNMAKFRKHGIMGFPNYAWQLSTYMIAMDLPGMMILKPKAGGPLYPVYFESPPYSLADITKRVMKIEASVALKRLPACPTPKMWPCPFPHQCDNPATETEENYIIDVLAAQYDDARASEKAASDRKKEFQQKIKLELQGTGRVDTVAWSVVESTADRTTYDTAKLEQEYPEAAAAVRSTKPVTTLRVTRKGK